MEPLKTTRMLRVAVDVDGVLVDQLTPVLEYVNKTYGRSYVPEDVGDWVWPIEGTGTDFSTVISNLMKIPHFVLTMPPITEVIKQIQFMSAGYRIVIATARTIADVNDTKQWLTDHGVVYDDFITTGHHGKSSVGCDVLIDDYPPNCTEFVAAGDRYALLVDRPYNRRFAGTDPHGRIRRVLPREISQQCWEISQILCTSP